MNEDGIFTSDFMLELSDGFKERLAFDITYGSTYFDNGNLSIGC